MIETVRKNYKGFTKEQIRKATEARHALAMMAHPRDDKLKHVVSNTNVITNCNFTSSDLTNALTLFSPDRGTLRGKTVRQRPDKVRPEYVSIPRSLFERIQNVTLAADVMFVNGLPFIVTISRAIKLITVEYLPSRTAEMLCDKLRKINKLYQCGGYNIRTSLMDMEFEPLVDKLTEMNVNTTAAREHVGDNERAIHTIKECCRCVISDLPYNKCMPDPFIIHLIYFVVMWINAFPADNGVSTHFLPREIITGLKLDYKKHCKALWGSYVEASDDNEVTNTMRARTSPCIVLGPTGNIQGSVKCYNLDTQQIIKRRTVTPLPMPDRIIKLITRLGKKSKQSRTTDKLTFLNRHKAKFDWDNEELDDMDGLVDNTPRDSDDLLAELPGMTLESDYDNNNAIQQPVESDLNIVEAAAANANLVMPVSADEITGVDYEEPAIFSDEYDSDDGPDDDEVEFLQENAPPHNPPDDPVDA